MKIKLLQIILIGAALFSTPVLADDDDTDRSPTYHVFADIDLIPTTKLEYGRPRIVIKAIVPKLVSEDDETSLSDYNAIVNEIISEEATSFKEEVKSHDEYQNTLASSDIKNDVIIDFDSALLNTGKRNVIISLRFAIQGVISGMPEAYRRHRVLNYDFETGRVIELQDLFTGDSDYLSLIAERAREQLLKKLTDKSQIAYGSAPSPDNYRIWNLTPGGLRITFDRNQVAPAIYGSQTVTIPYSDLSEIIDPDSILAKCIKHSRTCFSRHTNTGGFIDEAHNKKVRPTVIPPHAKQHASAKFEEGKFNV